MMELNKIHNIDCMVGMGKFPDKYFDLAIVDPPYGNRMGDKIYMGGDRNGTSYVIQKNGNTLKAYSKKFTPKYWDGNKPGLDYFIELQRISKKQIIWGGNYFTDKLPQSNCWIVWDKNNTGNYSDCELAWTNFEGAVRKFRWRWNGMIQENMKNKETRIHPTQKPLPLYKWTLKKYAREGWKILDTHVGSGSSIIACEYMGFDYCGFEIDKEYWVGANARLEKEREKMRQTSLIGEMQV